MDTESPISSEGGAPRSRIWAWIIVLFVVQIVVWISWLTFASHHRVQEVPLASGAAE
jgi:hypothetical protein